MCTVCVCVLCVVKTSSSPSPGQKEEKRLVDCIIRALNDDLQVVFFPLLRPTQPSFIYMYIYRLDRNMYIFYF